MAETGPCPFCPGNEHLNPIEIAAVGNGNGNGDGWLVRVTPDRDPLLRIEGDLDRRGAGMFDVMNAIGAHELVTDTREHTRTWADFTVHEMRVLVEVYRDRANDLRRDARFRQIVVLKNHVAAWSRFAHAHSHVVATPFIPRRIEEEIAGAREYYRIKERCAFCDQIAEERRSGKRLVASNAEFVSFAPFASAHPYEVWVTPLVHASDFGATSGRSLDLLAELLVDALARLRRTVDDPPYSVALHTAPLLGTDHAEFHWHWEVVPHLGREVGMEWATGIRANPMAPEEAAKRLRG